MLPFGFSHTLATVFNGVRFTVVGYQRPSHFSHTVWHALRHRQESDIGNFQLDPKEDSDKRTRQGAFTITLC